MSYTIIDKTGDEWLAERRKYVTATEVARLHTAGAPAFQALWEEKNGDQPGFAGNAYTRWGKQREPVIAEMVAFRFGLEANQRLCVKDGTRYAGTPDMIGDTMGGEIKTTVRSWEPRVDAVPFNYRCQIAWCQYVCGWDETVLAWEPHKNFVPGPVSMLIIPRDDVLIEALKVTADEFLDFSPEDAGEFDYLLARYEEANAEVERVKADLDQVRADIEEKVGEREKVSAKAGKVSLSVTMRKPAERFNQKRFKEDHPEQFGEYVEASGGEPVRTVSVRVNK